MPSLGDLIRIYRDGEFYTHSIRVSSFWDKIFASFLLYRRDRKNNRGERLTLPKAKPWDLTFSDPWYAPPPAPTLAEKKKHAPQCEKKAAKFCISFHVQATWSFSFFNLWRKISSSERVLIMDKFSNSFNFWVVTKYKKAFSHSDLCVKFVFF